MRKYPALAAAVLVCLLVAPRLDGGDNTLRGKVTYLAAGTVYTSLGREQGLRDSTLLLVVSKGDTIATVMVFALSSQSSSCMVVRSSRSVSIGDQVCGRLPSADPVTTGSAEISGSNDTSQPGGTASNGLPAVRANSRLAEGSFLDFHGRIGAQYISSMYDQSALNVAQPGFVLSLRGAMRDVPLKFDMYGNFRTISYGGRSPFTRSAVNQSRIYGLSLSYDDGVTVASLGRIIPIYAPSIGYVDGALVSRRFGNIVIGTVAGYQPDWNMRDVTTDFRKISLFAQYSSYDRLAFSMSVAYARTYYHSTLDREAGSLLLNTALTENLYLYGNAEFDLRQKSGEQLLLSPGLTSAYATLYCRVISSLTIGLGFDAARSYYSFEAVRSIPDSLLVNTLRSGMTVNMNWYLPGGISLQETYAPRSSMAPFAQEYSNTAALNIGDILSSGVSLRGNFSTNKNQFTAMTGYGFAAQATIARTADLTLRYQDNGYTLKQTDQRMRGTSLGGDLMLFLTRTLTFLASYDRRNDYGTISHSIFAELGLRF